MSTSFTLLSDVQEERCIALRLWGGKDKGQIVRFAFPEVLLTHLKDVDISGEDCSRTTIGNLFEKASTVEFLSRDVSPMNHLAFGIHGSPTPFNFPREDR